MKICPFCGYENTEDSRFCEGCGKQIAQEAQVSGENQNGYTQRGPMVNNLGQYNQPQQSYGYIPPNNAQNIPPEYKPLGMWAYFGYDLLMAIPLVGLIVAIIFSFTSTNINLKNYARSKFCWIIISVIIYIILLAIIGAAVGSASYLY